MALITLRDVNLSLGGPLLFNQVNLRVEPGDKLGLLGRNGEGKSTLFRLLKGELIPDSGSIEIQQGVTVSALAQEVPQGGGRVYDQVVQGLGEAGQVAMAYHAALKALDTDMSDAAVERLTDLQSDMDRLGAWDLDASVNKTLSRLSLDPDVEFNSLSGGMKRRVLLAQALVSEPDVLLLDEPTNHLDIASVEWLEGLLKQLKITLFVITHDRAFLQAVCEQIVELDRGELHRYECRYDLYTERRAHRLEVEAEQNKQFDKKLAQEETWIRQGIKARRTRNEGRVRALQELRKERAKRRDVRGTANLKVDTGQKSGKQVLNTVGLDVGYGDKALFSNLELQVIRGDKIGVLGANGIGKSTLLRTLLGEIKPLAGEIEWGTELNVAYFDQMRDGLDPSLSALDNVSGGSDQVTINGQTKHIMGYMQDFLFSPSQARAPITALSGGERNRLLLAKLFTQPANVLVMDEPTNDLDVETLELLESLLVDFSGTLFLISHDRRFIDNVVTQTWVLEPGRLEEYVGGYEDWLRQAQPNDDTFEKPKPVKASKPAPKKPKKKLSYKDQRELEELPGRVEALEAAVAGYEATLADPNTYNDPKKAAEIQQRFETDSQALEAAMERWLELEAMQDAE